MIAITMITETDWETGLPPHGVAVEAFIYGRVRRGMRSDGCFRVSDTAPCMVGAHALQNMTLGLDSITGWRYRAPEHQSLDMSMLSVGAMIQMMCCMGS